MPLISCKIKDLGRVVTGHTPPTRERKFYGKLFPLVKPTDMVLGERYIGETEESLSEVGYEKFRSSLLLKNTVCVVTIGTIGKHCLTKQDSFCNQAVNAILVDETKHDYRYVFYLMKHTIPRVKALSSGTSSGRENVSKGVFENIEVRVVSLTEQRRIGALLSAYDELIENNQRRIRILEEMTHSLYREWFVLFRFPGHEDHPRVLSTIGETPEGWEVKPITNSVSVNPKVAVPKHGEKPFIPMSSLSTDSMLISDIASRGGNSGSKFEIGDTLFARITPCLENGKTGFVGALPNESRIGFGSTEFIVLRGRTVPPEYVYCTARGEAFREHAIKSMTGATGRQRVQEASFEQFHIAEPPAWLCQRFSEFAAPVFRFIHQLHGQIENLRKTRDLLLPRLLSNQIKLEGN